jgi:putative tryptophan/tyrosine transport system substrate-binding protein
VIFSPVAKRSRTFSSESTLVIPLLPVTRPYCPLLPALVVSLVEKYRVPAIYPYRYFCASGGLAAYGVDIIDEYKRAASYVDRILRGEKPADLPVQYATKFDLVINLKTAKALGLTIPPSLLAIADEVIE